MPKKNAASNRKIEASKRKNEILAEARRLFAEHGYRAASMRDLADATGLLPGSLYAHFRSKADMAHEVVLEFFDALLPVQTAVFNGEGTGAERYALMVDAVYDVCEAHQESVRMMHYDWTLLSALPDFKDVVAATNQTLDLWRDVVRAGIADGSMRPDCDPEWMMRISASAMNGLMDRTRFQMRDATSPTLRPSEHLKRLLILGAASDSGRVSVFPDVAGAGKPAKKAAKRPVKKAVAAVPVKKATAAKPVKKAAKRPVKKATAAKSVKKAAKRPVAQATVPVKKAAKRTTPRRG